MSGFRPNDLVNSLVTTRRIVASMVALVMAVGLCEAREWRWYPRKAAPESDALRPELEGTRDDGASSGASELEEMRQWLYRRDVERRERGYTVPDTVEELGPPELERGGSAVPHGVRNEAVPASPVGGFDGGMSAARAREPLTPDFSPHGAAKSMATTEQVPVDELAEPESDASTVSPKKRGRKHAAHASRKHSRSAAKSRGSGRRRHR